MTTMSMGRQTTGGAFTDRQAFVPLQYHRQMVMLLPIHVVAGVEALVPVSIALATAKRAGAHTRTRMVFAVAMMVVAVTGICMVLLGADVFLGGISLFSGYLAASGWRDIRRRGAWSATDRLLAVLIGISAVVMAGIGLARLGDDPTIGITMLVFAGIAAGLTTFDVVRLSRPAPRFRGPRRRPPDQDAVGLHRRGDGVPGHQLRCRPRGVARTDGGAHAGLLLVVVPGGLRRLATTTPRCLNRRSHTAASTFGGHA